MALKQTTKFWIYALILNPVTTAIIWYMMTNGWSIFNVIGTAIMGYGLFFYFLAKAIAGDMRARKAQKKRKGGKKKRR